MSRRNIQELGLELQRKYCKKMLEIHSRNPAENNSRIITRELNLAEEYSLPKSIVTAAVTHAMYLGNSSSPRYTPLVRIQRAERWKNGRNASRREQLPR